MVSVSLSLQNTDCITFLIQFTDHCDLLIPCLFSRCIFHYLWEYATITVRRALNTCWNDCGIESNNNLKLSNYSASVAFQPGGVNSCIQILSLSGRTRILLDFRDTWRLFWWILLSVLPTVSLFPLPALPTLSFYLQSWFLHTLQSTPTHYAQPVSGSSFYLVQNSHISDSSSHIYFVHFSTWHYLQSHIHCHQGVPSSMLPWSSRITSSTECHSFQTDAVAQM